MKILIFVIILLTGFSEDIPRSWEKAGEKAVSKHFKADGIQMKRRFLETATDRPSPGIVMFELYIKDELIGYTVMTAAKGRYDYFDYLVIYDPGLVILNIQVFEYRSDHGYEICNKKWLNQFEGKRGCDLNYGKEIDAISGATYSAFSITEDLSILCRFLSENLK